MYGPTLLLFWRRSGSSALERDKQHKHEMPDLWMDSHFFSLALVRGEPRSIIRSVHSSLLAALVLLMAVGAAESKLPENTQADRVVVLKKQRTLTLMKDGQALKTYSIALGGEPVGPKEREGDHKTPEGVYVLDRRNPKSKFYRAVHISYPNEEDRARARKLGVSPGADIMVHGLPNGFGWLESLHRQRDWTDGCIAVTDQEMDEIWRAVADGTPIEIRP